MKTATRNNTILWAFIIITTFFNLNLIVLILFMYIHELDEHVLRDVYKLFVAYVIGYS